MKGKQVVRLILLGLVLAALAFGYLEFPSDSNRQETAPAVTSPVVEPPPPAAPVTRAPPSDGVLRIVENVAIKNYDKVIYRGPVDLSATIERIRAGIRHSHRNDGSVFGNRERLLPRQSRGYYKEYVHPTDGINGPGPQRIVVGEAGDWWYTPDHYASFVELGQEVSR